MRLLKIFVSMSILLGFINLNAQEIYLEIDKAPSEIRAYVATHFPENKIVSIKKDQELNKLEYEVKLEKRIELEFRSNYEIKKIESKSALPNSVIPEKVRAYVFKNYSPYKIVSWKQKSNKQEVELDNDWDLYFDLAGNFLRIDK
ncbi:MAG: PepSY-like domain-containing protein [Firmicutes bacterium]|nr:PepSY-like domain-containing protein [Bacillota bacterium]